MTSSNCTSAPLSWLVMEQYHLGELPHNERERVRAHLKSCPGCAQCMDSIENSSIALKPLPPIPAGFRTVAASALHNWKWQIGVVMAATAGVLALLLVWPFSQMETTTTATTAIPPGAIAYKGGDLAIGLTRYRGDSAVDEQPRRFIDGDAFAVKVTCPPIVTATWDITVFQGKDVAFPFDNARPLNCRNNLVLDGTFTLTGQVATTICLSVDTPVVRDKVSQSGISALPDSTVCTTVYPAR